MHHKFAIYDYDSLKSQPSEESKLSTGSCNWSLSAATKYDESYSSLGKTLVILLEHTNKNLNGFGRTRDLAAMIQQIFRGEIDAAQPRIKWDGALHRKT